jgi:hypothetical protein
MVSAPEQILFLYFLAGRLSSWWRPFMKGLSAYYDFNWATALAAQ